MDFMHIFEHNSSSVTSFKWKELLIVKGVFGRAAGI
jgi:hypothetical protein